MLVETLEVVPQRDLSFSVAQAAQRCAEQAIVNTVERSAPQPPTVITWVAGRYMDPEGNVLTYGQVKAAGNSVTVVREE